MAELSLIVWLALLLPGYAAMRLAAPRFVQAGLPGTIAVSMFAAFALASPVNIIGHVFGAPLWILTAWLIALFVASLIIITRCRWWSELRTLLVAALCIELVIVLVDLILAARVGTFLLGDAHTHLSRIRLVIDHGMINGHPFYGGQYFEPVYHTNLWHALIGCAAQLTGAGHRGVWWAVHPVATLLIVGGFWQLGWAVFQRTWPAWMAALFALGAFGSVPYLAYPNMLAPLWLVPIALSLVIDAIRRRELDWFSIAMLAAVGIVIGQVHGLYIIFLALTVTPVLAAVIIVHLSRRAVRPAVHTALCAAALTIGLAFPAYSVLRLDRFDANTVAVAANDAADDTTAEDVAHRPNRFGVGFTGRWWRLPLVLLSGAVLLVLLKQQRDAVAVMLGIFVAAGVWLWTTPLYGWLVSLFGDDWIIDRLGVMLRIGFIILTAGGIAALLDMWLQRARIARWRWQPWRMASLAAPPIGAMLFAPAGEFSWTAYLTAARRPADQRRYVLDELNALQAFASREIPSGSVILAPDGLGIILTTMTDCQLVRAFRNNLGVPDKRDRRHDRAAMLSLHTPPDVRQRLFEQYDVTCLVFVGRLPYWAPTDPNATARTRFPLLDRTITVVRLDHHDY